MGVLSLGGGGRSRDGVGGGCEVEEEMDGAVR